jgi:hypothetical protein
MEADSQNIASWDSAACRSFAVEAFVGRRVSGWPFGRFDVSARALRVRLSFPWSAVRSQEAAAIRAVVVARRRGGMRWLRFDDANGYMADVHVHSPFKLEQVIDELRRCGYQVIDDRS